MSKRIFEKLARIEGAGNSSALDPSEEPEFLLDKLLALPAEHIPSGEYSLEVDATGRGNTVVSDEQQPCNNITDSFNELLANRPTIKK